MNALPTTASDEDRRMKTVLLLTLAALSVPLSFLQEAAQKKVAAPIPKIWVTGNVRAPQAFDYKKEYTLMSVIGLTGGTSDFGAGIAYLIRDGAGTKCNVRLISHGRAKDPELLPWDFVHVMN